MADLPRRHKNSELFFLFARAAHFSLIWFTSTGVTLRYLRISPGLMAMVISSDLN